MKTGTENKLKFKQLMRKLQLALWQARGLLDTLWSFVATNCPAGDIGKFSNEEIAIGIDWQDDYDQLVNALVDCNWLDYDDEHRLIVHDWPDHCEDSVHTILAMKCESFACGRLPKLTRFTKDERPALIAKYTAKFGQHAVESGAVERAKTLRNAPERFETLENALGNAEKRLPSLALPNQTLPIPLPNLSAKPKKQITCLVKAPEAMGVAFAAAWEDWINHRKQIKKPLTELSAAKQMAEFVSWGPKKAIGAIEHTIRKGWQGIQLPPTERDSWQMVDDPLGPDPDEVTK